MSIATSMPEKFRTPANLAPHWAGLFAGEYDVSAEWSGPPTILDVGACIGAFARWARIRWPKCFLHCYEPNPKAHKLLEYNVQVLGAGVELHKVAVLGRAEPGQTVTLYQGTNNLGEASVYLETGADASQPVEVPAIGAKDLPQADILKADAEGVEPEILTELVQLERVPKVVMVEYHSAGAAALMQQMMADVRMRLVKAFEYDINRGVMIWRHEPEAFR